ncbi:MAG: orotate phosphoribosyltransferase [Spirochaetia bacterium]|nr:orotate phosphoribosyltransferase [Spirochaetia bacterium]
MNFENNIFLNIKEEKENLKNAIKTFSYKENHNELFTLASGKKSPYYFDLKQTLLQPIYLRAAGSCMLYLIQEKLGKLPKAAAGLTMGADPLIYSISLLTAEINEPILPIIVRKQEKDHGSQKKIEGLLNKIKNINNEEIVLIDDVITTGGSTLKAYEAIKEAGIPVKYAFCVLNRFEGGSENLMKHNIELFSLFNLDDFRASI